MTALTLTALIFLLLPSSIHSFTQGRQVLAQFKKVRAINSKNEEEDYSICRQEPMDSSLLPPSYNLRKESLLFDANSSSKASNNVLRLWKWCKQNLPYVLTGCDADSTVADDTPLAGLYNMLIVRLPTISAGIVYTKNLVDGHPLIIDVGNGPWEVPPIVVAVVLGAILR